MLIDRNFFGLSDHVRSESFYVRSIAWLLFFLANNNGNFNKFTDTVNLHYLTETLIPEDKKTIKIDNKISKIKLLDNAILKNIYRKKHKMQSSELVLEFTVFMCQPSRLNNFKNYSELNVSFIVLILSHKERCTVYLIIV